MQNAKKNAKAKEVERIERMVVPFIEPIEPQPRPNPGDPEYADWLLDHGATEIRLYRRAWD